MHACQCVCQWSRYAFAVLLLNKIKHTCETNMIPYSDHNRWDTAIAIAEMCTLRNTNANLFYRNCSELHAYQAQVPKASPTYGAIDKPALIRFLTCALICYLCWCVYSFARCVSGMYTKSRQAVLNIWFKRQPL